MRSDEDFVFYGQPASSDGSVRHAGDVAGGQRLTVEPSGVPGAIETVAITASIHEYAARGHSFAQVSDARIAVSVGGQAVAEYEVGPEVSAESALIFGELYRRGGQWKFRAVGQGYTTGLAGIATDFGVSIDEAPAPAAPAPPAPAASGVDFEKQRTVDLRKKVESKAPVLLEKFNAAAVSLEKKGLTGERAEVVLVLDVSGSSRPLFRNGTYQALIDRFLAAALLFDDNGTVDTWLFDTKLHESEPVTLDNRDGWTDRAIERKGIWGGTFYHPPIEEIAFNLTRGAKMPTYVAFITDGANADRRDTEKAITKAASYPAFFQFMAVGRENDFPQLQKLDELTGREVDNAGFFAVQEPARVSDADFYDLVMTEFPAWLKAARGAGILGR